MEKFLQNLEEADKIIKTVDHLVYVTFPLVKDKRMLIKILVETKNAVALCINAMLQRDYIYRKVRLYKDAKENFRTFEERCAPRYNLSFSEISKIKNLFDIAEKHKKSPLEFMRKDKIVIMSENSGNFHTETISHEKVKDFVNLAKSLLSKIENVIKIG
ncbi:MAG: hypothetical protein WD876_02870 [Candidatus Pacearchaeota archaeon]